MILAGRRLNDSMANYVAGAGRQAHDAARRSWSRVRASWCSGLTFKENCPDLRNSKVADVVRELKNYGAKVDVYDPWIDRDEAEHEYGIRPVKTGARRQLRRRRCWRWATRNSAIAASAACARRCKKNHVVYDIKYLFPADQSRWARCKVAHENPAHRRGRVHRLRTSRRSCWRAATKSSVSTISTTTTIHAQAARASRILERAAEIPLREDGSGRQAAA